jgi:hypothetical protein
MRRNGLRKKETRRRALLSGGVLCVLLVVVTGPVTHACADGGIDVNCYSQQGAGDSVGEVTVYDTARASATCNAVYYDCHEECVGCFIDSDYSETVCADASGRLFLK